MIEAALALSIGAIIFTAINLWTANKQAHALQLVPAQISTVRAHAQQLTDTQNKLIGELTTLATLHNKLVDNHSNTEKNLGILKDLVNTISDQYAEAINLNTAARGLLVQEHNKLLRRLHRLDGE